MRFVSVRDLRAKSAEVWRDLPGEREMVITSNGRPVAILAAVNESNLEDSLSAFRQARAIDAVAALQRASVARGTDKLTAEEIEAEIRAVREKREG
ncbi:MAG TPA: type II toxin-antitoxin system Phd/YefM family antitoxin [Coriobacteriia bacterium]|jgi:antitoxin (DNA-binding transcriptional repressor) of toxin-antitoxin stability system